MVRKGVGCMYKQLIKDIKRIFWSSMLLRMTAIVFSDLVYICFSYALGSMTSAVVKRSHISMESSVEFFGLMILVLVVTPLLLYESNKWILKQSIMGDEEYLKKVLCQFPEKIARKETGKLSSEILDFSLQLRWAVIDVFVYRCEFVVMLAAFLFFCLKMNVFYSLLVAFLAVLNGIKSKIVSDKISEWKVKEMDGEQQVNHLIYESVESFDYLYLNRFANVAVEKINSRIEWFTNSIIKKKNRLTIICDMVTRYMDDLCYVAILLCGFLLMNKGMIEIGAIITMSYYYAILSKQFECVEKLLEAKGMMKCVGKKAAELVEEEYVRTEETFDGMLIKPFNYRKGEFVLNNKNSIEIVPGDKVAIVGENGAGKTTMLYLLLGIYEAPEGAFFLNGKSCTNVRMRELCSFIDVDSDMLEEWVHEYVVANVDTAIENYETAIRQLEIGHLLNRNGLELSGGERRRSDIVRAIIEDKQIWALDEPEVFLDKKWKDEVIKVLQESKKTIIFTTHDLEFAKAATKVIRV